MTSAIGNPPPVDRLHPLISVERARQAAVAGVLPISGSETLPLRALLGRVLDEAVYASIALPPFDQSAMDGYAVRSREISSIPATKVVSGRHAAGQRPSFASLPPNSAVRILTGAVVPQDFDAVVKDEHCSRSGETVTIDHRPSAGDNVRRSGEDVASGALIVDRDRMIDARHIAIMAAAGSCSAFVRRKINVGLISTGDEIRDTGESLEPGDVHDSNRPMLAAMLDRP